MSEELQGQRRSVGRPTEYRTEYIARAKEMCAGGATDMELADEFDVSIQTLYNWRAKYPEFLEAIKTNKPIADERVERSLFERATGYERDSVKIFCDKDGRVTEVPFREYVPPDSTAMIFWLKNRKPKEWRDKAELNLTGDPLSELLKEFKREYDEIPKADAPDANS
jgi:transposase-like protein